MLPSSSRRQLTNYERLLVVERPTSANCERLMLHIAHGGNALVRTGSVPESYSPGDWLQEVSNAVNASVSKLGQRYDLSSFLLYLPRVLFLYELWQGMIKHGLHASFSDTVYHSISNDAVVPPMTGLVFMLSALQAVGATRRASHARVQGRRAGPRTQAVV